MGKAAWAIAVILGIGAISAAIYVRTSAKPPADDRITWKPHEPEPAPTAKPMAIPTTPPERLGEPADGGTLMVYSAPAAAVRRDGVKLSNGGLPTKVALNRTAGMIALAGGEAPFEIAMRYRLSGKNVELSLDTKPWSIIKRDGIALGRSPRQGIGVGSSTQRFEFVSPGVAPMTLVISYTPP